MDVKFCSGCEDNFYNGNNPYGITECWHRAKAEQKSYRLIPISMPPPYLQISLKKLPNCYKAKGYAKVKPEALDSRGYWKTV